MRQVVYTCDVCGEKRSEKELFQIKVKGANQEDIFADRKTIDICDYCIAKFKDFVRKERKKI